MLFMTKKVGRMSFRIAYNDRRIIEVKELI
jgi:hypothetical protein